MESQFYKNEDYSLKDLRLLELYQEEEMSESVFPFLIVGKKTHLNFSFQVNIDQSRLTMDLFKSHIFKLISVNFTLGYLSRKVRRMVLNFFKISAVNFEGAEVVVQMIGTPPKENCFKNSNLIFNIFFFHQLVPHLVISSKNISHLVRKNMEVFEDYQLLSSFMKKQLVGTNSTCENEELVFESPYKINLKVSQKNPFQAPLIINTFPEGGQVASAVSEVYPAESLFAPIIQQNRRLRKAKGLSRTVQRFDQTSLAQKPQTGDSIAFTNSPIEPLWDNMELLELTPKP